MQHPGLIGLTAFEAVEINQEVMIGRAIREIFEEEIKRPNHNFDTIEPRHMGVVRAVYLTTRLDPEANLTAVAKRIRIENNVAESVARKHRQEALDIGLVAVVRKRHRRQVKLIALAPGIWEKTERLAQVKMKIARVVAAQIDAPHDGQAGAKLIASNLYFNILDPMNEEAGRAGMDNA